MIRRIRCDGRLISGHGRDAARRRPVEWWGLGLSGASLTQRGLSAGSSVCMAKHASEKERSTEPSPRSTVPSRHRGFNLTAHHPTGALCCPAELETTTEDHRHPIGRDSRGFPARTGFGHCAIRTRGGKPRRGGVRDQRQPGSSAGRPVQAWERTLQADSEFLDFPVDRRA